VCCIYPGFSIDSGILVSDCPSTAVMYCSGLVESLSVEIAVGAGGVRFLRSVFLPISHSREKRLLAFSWPCFRMYQCGCHWRDSKFGTGDFYKKNV
jgi:hypothetical protein